MSRERTERGEIVLIYVKNYPGVAKKTLATKINDDHPGKFKSPEHIRSLIRYYTGQLGKDNRIVARKYSENFYSGEGYNKIYDSIPDGEYNDYERHVVDINKHPEVGIICDIHMPYHDKRALMETIEYFLKHNIKTVMILGDLTDMKEISYWNRDRRITTFQEEKEMTKVFLKTLQNEFHVIFKEGNHEERLDVYLKSKAPEIADLPELQWEALLRLDNDMPNLEYIGDRRVIQYGKLNAVHGHEFGRSIFSPVNPARGFFLRAKDNVIGGHYHQSSEHIEGNLSFHSLGAFSLGCLCDLHPEWRPLNKWGLGFATAEITNESGAFNVDNRKIIR